MTWQINEPQTWLREAGTAVLRLTPPQILIMSFVGLAMLGTLLLKLPAATLMPITWTEAMFTAVSAATVTGLTVVDTGTHYSLFGQLILLVLMQSGGLGLMASGVFIIHLTSGRLGLRNRAALSEALNQSGQADMRRLMWMMFGFALVIEIVGTILLALHWVPQRGLIDGLYFSVFHTISAFNSGGFALLPDSMSSEVGSPIVNGVITMLYISGGIGFVVIADMVGKRRFRDYQLHTKLMVVGTLLINMIAMLTILLLEHGNPATLGGLAGEGSKLWAAWFQATTPRSAGFNTIDTGALTTASALFIMGLMFIGGGSGSTASGIKLSTFIVLLLATRAFLLQRDRPVVFGRSIDQNTILKALAIIIIGLMCAISGTFLLTITESTSKPFLDLAFEAVSAFGTVGLSRGITPDLSIPGQFVVMVLMLIGRVGPLALAFTLATSSRADVQYPAGRVNIG